MNNIELIHNTGNYLYRGVARGFRKGRNANPKKINKFGIGIEYGVDKALLQNFMCEAFTVGGVLNIKLRDKLKDLAQKIIEGKTGEQVARGIDKVDGKKLFVERSRELLEQYQYIDKPVPDGYLKTSLQTAVSSSYGAGLWNNITEAGIYPYLMYKTREDNKVRPDHARLNGRVFYKNDEIWEEIYPPNGWNCRCYIIPLTASEAKGITIESPERMKQQSQEIIKEVDIDFRRNAAMQGSIWGKWLKDELADGKVIEDLKKSWDEEVLKDEIKSEVWGEIFITSKETKSILRFIDYNKDGFNIKVIESDGKQMTLSEQLNKDIKEIDNYRKGISIMTKKD